MNRILTITSLLMLAACGDGAQVSTYSQVEVMEVDCEGGWNMPPNATIIALVAFKGEHAYMGQYEDDGSDTYTTQYCGRDVDWVRVTYVLEQ